MLQLGFEGLEFDGFWMASLDGKLGWARLTDKLIKTVKDPCNPQSAIMINKVLLTIKLFKLSFYKWFYSQALSNIEILRLKCLSSLEWRKFTIQKIAHIIHWLKWLSFTTTIHFVGWKLGPNTSLSRPVGSGLWWPVFQVRV